MQINKIQPDFFNLLENYRRGQANLQFLLCENLWILVIFLHFEMWHFFQKSNFIASKTSKIVDFAYLKLQNLILLKI